MPRTEATKSLHQWRLTRLETKQTKAKFRATADRKAAELLLCHSIAMGHGSLLVQRYVIAEALGVPSLERYAPYFEATKEQIGAEAVSQALGAAKHKAELMKSRRPIQDALCTSLSISAES
jgi:hypothetical protein